MTFLEKTDFVKAFMRDRRKFVFPEVITVPASDYWPQCNIPHISFVHGVVMVNIRMGNDTHNAVITACSENIVDSIIYSLQKMAEA